MNIRYTNLKKLKLFIMKVKIDLNLIKNPNFEKR